MRNYQIIANKLNSITQRIKDTPYTQYFVKTKLLPAMRSAVEDAFGDATPNKDFAHGWHAQYHYSDSSYHVKHIESGDRGIYPKLLVGKRQSGWEIEAKNAPAMLFRGTYDGAEIIMGKPAKVQRRFAHKNKATSAPGAMTGWHTHPAFEPKNMGAKVRRRFREVEARLGVPAGFLTARIRT